MRPDYRVATSRWSAAESRHHTLATGRRSLTQTTLHAAAHIWGPAARGACNCPLGCPSAHDAARASRRRRQQLVSPPTVTQTAFEVAVIAQVCAPVFLGRGMARRT